MGDIYGSGVEHQGRVNIEDVKAKVWNAVKKGRTAAMLLQVAQDM